MPLPILGAIIAAAPAVYKMISGISQKSKAEKDLKGLERPEYQTPKEVLQSVGMSRTAYGDRAMPGEQQMLDRAAQTQANAMAMAGQAGNPFAALGSITASTQKSMQDIGIQSAQHQTTERNQLQSMLQMLGGFRDQEFQMNEFAPYVEKYRESRDVLGASQKNIHESIGSFSNIGLSLMAGLTGTDAKTTTASDDDAKKIKEKYNTESE